MAEFPNLGKYCSVSVCKALDFLPMKCDSCGLIFCRSHIMYELHHCESANSKDIQVPICPLCSQPVPTSRNELPDVKVNQHIDRDCKSDPAQKRRKKELQCSIIACKRRGLVPINCLNCCRNFCLTHLHTTEHNCTGKRDNLLLRKLSLSANIYQSTKNDEELAKAINASMNDGKSMDTDELNRLLALQLQQEEFRCTNNITNAPNSHSSKRCEIS